MALTTYSHAVWVFEFWSQMRFNDMMIGKILYEELVDVNIFYDYASQNLAWCRLETILCSMHACGVESQGLELNNDGHAKAIQAFPTIGLLHCEIQLVAHPF